MRFNNSMDMNSTDDTSMSVRTDLQERLPVLLTVEALDLVVEVDMVVDMDLEVVTVDVAVLGEDLDEVDMEEDMVVDTADMGDMEDLHTEEDSAEVMGADNMPLSLPMTLLIPLVQAVSHLLPFLSQMYPSLRVIRLT